MDWHELSDEVRGIWVDNAPFWDEHMGEEGNDFHQRLVVPTVERLLELQPGWRVLEIACGNGNFSRRMATRGAEVVAFDVSDTFIQRARQRTADHAGHITYQVLDAGDEVALRALGERAFDAAVCNMALMDMPAIEPLFAALSRLLKPQGRFVFSLMHPCFNSAGLTRMVEVSDAGGVLTTTHSVRVSHYHTPQAHLGLGIAGQPRPHYYFHRSISDLFNLGFRHGFVINGLEEPVFTTNETAKHLLSLAHFAEIPPVLAARFILAWPQAK